MALGLSVAAQKQVDSFWVRFSDNLRWTIRDQLNNLILKKQEGVDTVNFIGVYMFKCNISMEGNAENFYGSKNAPPKLGQIVKGSIDSCLQQIRHTSDFTSRAGGKVLLLPIVLDYEPFPGKPLARNIKTEDVLNLMLFEDTPAKSSKTSFAYTGIPIENVSLPALYYRTPHVRGAPRQWVDADKENATK